MSVSQERVSGVPMEEFHGDVIDVGRPILILSRSCTRNPGLHKMEKKNHALACFPDCDANS